MCQQFFVQNIQKYKRLKIQRYNFNMAIKIIHFRKAYFDINSSFRIDSFKNKENAMKQFLSIALFFTSSVAIAIEEKPVSSEQFGTCYGFYLGDYQSVRANQDEIVCFKNAVEQHVEISFCRAQEGKIDSLPETVVIAKLVSSETVITPSKSKRVNIYENLIRI